MIEIELTTNVTVAEITENNIDVEIVSTPIEVSIINANAPYTDEQAQDAVGGMVNDTLVYVDATPSLGINLNKANVWTQPQSVPEDAYGVGWDGSVQTPTKNAIYDKIESLVSSITTNTSLVGVGSIGDPLGINLAHANAWTAAQSSTGTFLNSATTDWLAGGGNDFWIAKGGYSIGTGSIGLYWDSSSLNVKLIDELGAYYPLLVQSIDAAFFNGGAWNGNTIGVSYGGTGLTSVTSGQVLFGNGTSALSTSTSFTFAAGVLSLGVSGTKGGLNLLGNTSGTVSVLPQAVAGTYNFNLPTSAGSSGQPLLSGGGGAAAQTYGTLGVGGGGTGTTTAFTSGNVIFAGASGVYSQDTGFSYDSTNNRLAVASAALTPVSKVHIDGGNATASDLRFTVGTTTGQTSTDGFSLGVTTAAVAELRQYEAQAINFYTSNTLRGSFLSGGGFSIDAALLTFTGTQPNWTTAGATKSIEIPNNSSLKWAANGSSYRWGVTQFTGGLYWQQNSADTSATALYRQIWGDDGSFNYYGGAFPGAADLTPASYLMSINGRGASTLSPFLSMTHLDDNDSAKNMGFLGRVRANAKYITFGQTFGQFDNSLGAGAEGIQNFYAFQFSSKTFSTVETPTVLKGWRWTYYDGAANQNILDMNILSGTTGVIIAKPTTDNQLSVRYNASNRLDVKVSSAGDATLAPSGGNTTHTGNFKLGTVGNKLFIKEGSGGTLGQVALVAGTKAITITGLTTSSRAFVQLVTPNTTAATVQYQAVCTANTLTIQANVAAGTINIADISTVNYFVIEPS